MASDRQQALSSLAEARRELLAAIEGLSDDQLSRASCLGDWAAKDILSHIASWEEACARDFRRIAAGDAPGLAAFKEERVNEYNAALMAFRLHLPAAQARREFETARAEILEAVEGLPDGEFAEGRFARLITNVQAGHDRDHASHIREWRRREGL